jgi:hypothetical protein
VTSVGSRPTWLQARPSIPPACVARPVERTSARQSQSCGASRNYFGALREHLFDSFVAPFS